MSKPTRVLLALKLMDNSVPNAELCGRAALLLGRQPGVERSSGGAGYIELHYYPEQIMITDLIGLLRKASIRAGIS